LEGVRKWLRKNANTKVFERIAKKLNFLEKELCICRYDFFLTIKEIVEKEDKALAKKFEIFVRAFDFEGSLIS